MKSLKDLEPEMGDDIWFADRTAKAYLEFEKGEYSREKDVDFIETMKSW